MNVKIVIGVILLLITPFAAFACFLSYRQAQASGDWPATKGTVTVSRVDSTIGRKTKAKISYDYSVNGSSFVGTRVRFNDTTGSGRNAQEQLIEPYPVGAKVDVFYDPSSPNISILEAGAGWGSLGLFLIPILLVGIAAFFLTAGFQAGKQSKRSEPRIPPKKHRQR